ncbi:hypothetical protein B0T14DRAFT_603418 [Immersiella caudata]|uniref:Uncharacterized protein n=1 Tax=Immersiella caudata TaxID=314043 RepID=A0AA39WQD7_9PEZI|nr:hypothetical protein B0T14DRAFT_603418 [Immersiella caudata]
MSNPNIITAYSTPQPGQPVRPPGLGALGKMRWGLKHPPADPTVSFAGKTVLVTGSNTGLGFEAAVKYSALGASKLILGVRTAEKGEDTKRRILTQTGRDADSIGYLLVDLSTFASVQKFCKELDKEVSSSGLDVALLCAGLAPPGYKTSPEPEGWELALQVNVLSTTVMALLMLPSLRRTGANGGVAPHLTFVNSGGNDMVQKEWLRDFDGSAFRMVNDKKGWNSFRNYTVVKLMGLVVMKDMARQMAGGDGGPEVIVNAVCPGMCKTDLGRDHPWVQKMLMAGASPFIHRTAEEGGRSLVSATALGPESHGKFWHNDLLYPMHELINDDEFCSRTLKEIMDVVSRVPGI